MAFDTGVFLTVVGAVMLALANLSRMGRWTSPCTINKTAMDVDPSASLPKEHG
jgi:multicomponent K+:H+ antiporter subunit A